MVLSVSKFCLFFCLTALAAGQIVSPTVAGPGSNDSFQSQFGFATGDSVPVAISVPADGAPVALVASVALPRMGPELALQVYRNRTGMQASQISSYSARTVIRAQLPDTQQQGEYELERHYSAPRMIVFKALSFTGDNFVKNNVILRLLQSEVDHAQKDDPASSAISPVNYKFSYKGTRQLEGHIVHIYQLKPRQKRAGLFKGRIYLDAYSGSMVRAEGTLAKSPSLFIKKIEFVQDYANIDTFTLPVHLHSEAQTRLVGRAIVDVYNSDYRALSDPVSVQTSPAL